MADTQKLKFPKNKIKIKKETTTTSKAFVNAHMFFFFADINTLSIASMYACMADSTIV